MSKSRSTDKGSSQSTSALIIRPTPRGTIPPPPPPPPTSRSRPLPLQWPPPVMGVPGVTAFTPYARHDPPSPPRGDGSPLLSPGTGSSMSSGVTAVSAPTPSPPVQSRPQQQLQGAVTAVDAVAVAVVGGSGDGPPPVRGSSSSSRKRSREESSGADAGEGGGGDHPILCSVCAKQFLSSKALFGHMRSHRDRGWKGARPPPAFKADEEFADLRQLLQPPSPERARDPAPLAILPPSLEPARDHALLAIMPAPEGGGDVARPSEEEPEPARDPVPLAIMSAPEGGGEIARPSEEEEPSEEDDLEPGSGAGGRSIPDLNA